MLIDAQGGRLGWFVDATPGDDQEFAPDRLGNQWVATAGSPAAGRMDLLTAVMHELGHVLGYTDLTPQGSVGSLMTGSLPAGVRRLPTGQGAGISTKDEGQRTNGPKTKDDSPGADGTSNSSFVLRPSSFAPVTLSPPHPLTPSPPHPSPLPSAAADDLAVLLKRRSRHTDELVDQVFSELAAGDDLSVVTDRWTMR